MCRPTCRRAPAPACRFRVAATGVVTELDAGKAKVVKKLKLVGEPHKIFKNTCFVKNMFSSPLPPVQSGHVSSIPPY